MVGYFLVHDHHAAALSLFAYAGITDLIDGYLARRWNLQTVVGTIIDPMADKLLMTIGVACLAVNGSIPGRFPTELEKAIRTDKHSLACCDHPRPRCRPGIVRHILPLDFPPAPENNGPVLGLFPSICRGQTNRDLQDQHRSAASPCRFCHCNACSPGDNVGCMASSRSDDWFSVSSIFLLFSIIFFYCIFGRLQKSRPIKGAPERNPPHTTIGCGKQGFPSAQPYLSHTPAG